jgi:hypothetical protein
VGLGGKKRKKSDERTRKEIFFLLVYCRFDLINIMQFMPERRSKSCLRWEPKNSMIPAGAWNFSLLLGILRVVNNLQVTESHAELWIA